MKLLSDEKNRIAIGPGKPEIHQFEVRCFEQKLGKLTYSRYLKVHLSKFSQIYMYIYSLGDVFRYEFALSTGI